MSGIVFRIPYDESISQYTGTNQLILQISKEIESARKTRATNSIAAIVPEMVAINIKSKERPNVLNVVNNIMLAARSEGKNRARSIFAEWTRSEDNVIEIQTEQTFF